jgi:5-methylthioribose kinase
VSQTYFPLDPTTVLDYVRARPEVAHLFHADEPLESVEVGDGNLNLVFKVWAVADPDRTVVVKQALPYVRLVGDSWKLPTDRARIEAQALAIHARLCPEHTPAVYYFDPVMFAIVMQNLNRHIIMRRGLIEGITYPKFAEHIGTFMGRTLAGTSDFVLDYRTKKEEVARFINPELCKISEDLIFTEPYRPTERNLFHKELEPDVLALQADESLRVEVAAMKAKFMTNAQALLHGDLHTGSIMVNQDETVCIDPEFAFYGPIGFDVGAVIANLFLSYASHEVRTPDPQQRAAFRSYLTNTVIELYDTFQRTFAEVAWADADPIDLPIPYRQAYLDHILEDAIGFAACKMMRRVIGLAGVADIRGIEDVDQRTIAARLALRMAVPLLKRRRAMRTIIDAVDLVRTVRADEDVASTYASSFD